MSKPFWSSTLIPTISGAIISLTFLTAVNVPFPKYLFLSPSLNSQASCSPVDAPEGTFAVPVVPSASVIVAETVGNPLESKHSKAETSVIESWYNVHIILHS